MEGTGPEPLVTANTVPSRRPITPTPIRGWRYTRFPNIQSLTTAEGETFSRRQPRSPEAAQSLAAWKHPIISSPTCRIT
jgi:hypothetical protein